MRVKRSTVLCLIIFSFGVMTVSSRQVAVHNINKFVTNVDNFGFVGISFHSTGLEPDLSHGYWIDFGGEYPKGSNLSFAPNLGFMIGAIVGTDTLVSSSYSFIQVDGKVGEFQPDEPPFDELVYRSILDSTNHLAISEEDWVSTVTDTSKKILDPLGIVDYSSHRPHKPMFLQVTTKSHAWSYGYAEDFVLVSYEIKNIGSLNLQDAYVGFVTEPMIYFLGSTTTLSGLTCGFLPTHQGNSYSRPCSFVDSVNIAWAADNDGNPFNGEFTDIVQVTPSGDFVKSLRHVLGFSLLNSVYPLGGSVFTPQRISYNWTIQFALPENPDIDYGPQLKQHFRDFRTGGGSGVPVGDKNKYHVMSTPEIDFPSIYTALISRSNTDWVNPPPNQAEEIASGASWIFNILSLGPYTLEPGASISIPVAIVAGENFHIDPNNGANLPNNPDQWMRNVDFSDLVKNTLWAQWIYDNPGVDTDGDGYFGNYHVCVIDSEFVDGEWAPSYADTIWYRGDGVPDWKGAGPPPAPYTKVTQTLNGIKVTFNGERSETEKDIFSRIVDFEGYRVYVARDDRATSYSRYASYDVKNYDIWVWNKHTNQYDLKDVPLSLDSLRCRYSFACDDSAFNPLDYTSFDPYNHPLYSDSIYYFTMHDYNTSELGVSTPIKKVYPTTRDPRTVPAGELIPDDYTEDGHLKFFEYECEITGLLSSVPYWVNVTAFDFGSPKTGLSPLETSVTLNAKQVFPASSTEELTDDSLKVYVYPNPYRIDADYRDRGFEGRTRDDFPDDKVRQLNFANLPYTCTIRVYTLDGDMVVEKKHDADPSDPTGRHDYWSLINLNRQIIVSGLYYWTVEEPNGKVQMGKFMVIR